MRTLSFAIATCVVFVSLPAKAAEVNCDNRYLWTCDVRSPTGEPAHKEKHARKTHRHVVRVATRPAPAHEIPGKTLKGYSEHIFNGPAKAGIVTVQTVVGIPIRVAASVADKFTGFIADLAKRGIKPDTIHCYATGGHVRHSWHYVGRACDFNGSASKWAPMNRGRVADLARKWGLRDGCTFLIRGGRPDCGHIDAPTYVAHRARHRQIVAKARYGMGAN